MELDKHVINYIRYDVDMTRALCVAQRLNQIERSQRIMRRSVLATAIFAIVNVAALRAVCNVHSEKIEKLRKEIKELKGE